MCASNRANNGLATLAGSFCSEGGSSRVGWRAGLFSSVSRMGNDRRFPPFSTYFAVIFSRREQSWIPESRSSPRAAPRWKPSGFPRDRDARRWGGRVGLFLVVAQICVTFIIPCGIQPPLRSRRALPWHSRASGMAVPGSHPAPPFQEGPTMSPGFFPLWFWGDFVPFWPCRTCFNCFSPFCSVQ